MPLSKERQAEWMREYRQRHACVITNSAVVQPNYVEHPNRYPLAHLAMCHDYNPIQPLDHFSHCPFVNPMLQPKTDSVIPKYDMGFLYPDGRMRLETGTLIDVSDCKEYLLIKGR